MPEWLKLGIFACAWFVTGLLVHKCVAMTAAISEPDKRCYWHETEAHEISYKDGCTVYQVACNPVYFTKCREGWK